jgi:hemoglobin-like flavoprotein
MDSGQKALIKASFRRVLTVADLAGELFSGRLYLLDPALWLLLGVGTRKRQQELIRMLAAAVKDLDRFEHLASTLEAVARRSVSQGMNEVHFATIAGTLLWTLQQVLGDSFGERLAAAWRAACTLLVERMQGAAIAQAVEPTTLRRLRCSSCPEFRDGALRPLAVLPPIHEPAEDAELEIGRLAELPPPPTSARA